MDDIFKNMQKQGKNDVDSLVQWIKDSKLIDSTKEQEEKARNLFKDAADKSNIELDKFKSVVQKLAEDQKKNFDDLAKQLAAEGPKLMKAAMAGVSAFKDAMTGK
ncbi:uncharacterized protein LOC113498972 isoform X5 [Trichoplusia ni]|uniref:Uncharacterized protein LOC113498869 isoform X3 n=1 Tax=Trichoplusia ni TaxID=7111 RepID=A0A7E5W352_TRINI|nr:uncharacterized protein LOC113498869 isoform X3 [Trichoplusia ni]XP_026735053.1 uncharacterized protein LOC113498972 isoform X5 [Trichoplusia ni]